MNTLTVEERLKALRDRLRKELSCPGDTSFVVREVMDMHRQQEDDERSTPVSPWYIGASLPTLLRMDEGDSFFDQDRARGIVRVKVDDDDSGPVYEFFYYLMSSLPSMCGGKVVTFYRHNYAPLAVIKSVIFNRNLIDGVSTMSYSGFTGSSQQDEEWDEEDQTYYEVEGTELAGPLGQILIKFDASCSVHSVEALHECLWEDYKELLDSGGDHYEERVARGRSRWLSQSMVGFFAEYTGMMGYREDLENNCDEDARNMRLASTVPYFLDLTEDDREVLCRMAFHSTAHKRLTALTYLRPLLSLAGSSYEETVYFMWLNSLSQMVAMALGRGQDVVITDSTEGSITAPGTMDLITWIVNNKDVVKTTLERLHCNMEPEGGLVGATRGDTISVVEFAAANNPNEGAHPIIGVCISAVHRSSYARGVLSGDSCLINASEELLYEVRCS